jgi:hypothetical protein
VRCEGGWAWFSLWRPPRVLALATSGSRLGHRARLTTRMPRSTPEHVTTRFAYPVARSRSGTTPNSQATCRLSLASDRRQPSASTRALSAAVAIPYARACARLAATGAAGPVQSEVMRPTSCCRTCALPHATTREQAWRRTSRRQWPDGYASPAFPDENRWLRRREVLPRTVETGTPSIALAAIGTVRLRPRPAHLAADFEGPRTPAALHVRTLTVQERWGFSRPPPRAIPAVLSLAADTLVTAASEDVGFAVHITFAGRCGDLDRRHRDACGFEEGIGTASAFLGRSSVKTHPLPGMSRMRISPPLARAALRLMTSPSPTPVRSGPRCS